MSSKTMSLSLQAAAIFLTRPLLLFVGKDPAAVQTLQVFLHTTLLTTPSLANNSYDPCAPRRLVCSPNTPPPLPIHLACIASGITWTDWIQALGGSAFILCIESTITYVVRADNGQVGVIWPTEAPSSVPQPAHTPAPFSVPQFARRPTPTFPVTEEENYDSDADSIAPSTSSRPSSRASHYSNYSFASFSSGSSHTSISSLPHRTATVPTPPKSNTPTKYLYQGGVSNVLTGGVMLGAAPSSAKPAFSSAAPSPRVVPPRFSQPSPSTGSTPPFSQTVYIPQHRSTRTPCPSPSATANWRRTPVTH